MPRRPRIHLPGLPLHIVQRGHNRDACFFVEEDFQSYRHWLGEALREFGAALHAYVLMKNHVHLLITPKQPEDVSRIVISLGRRYVQYINKTYRLTGTLWDSRYKSSLVQEDHYLLLCQRYIELNPVRADLVNDPAHYRWSSYRANGLGQSDLLITPHSVYSSLGTDEAARLTAYRVLFWHELDDEAIADMRLALNQGQPFGNGRFLDTIERMTGQRREARPRGRPRKADSPPKVLDGQFGLDYRLMGQGRIGSPP
jgi:putative transposase